MNRKRYRQAVVAIAWLYVCVTGILMFQVSTAYSQWQSDQVVWDLATSVSEETKEANERDFGLSEFKRPELPEYTEPSHKYSIFPWELLKEKEDIISIDKRLRQQMTSHLEYVNGVLYEYNHRKQ